ncbi:hypothetical protein RSOLAG1IB_11366 [Rhizoctonia solani AG-1 IB]|uniref:Uncharacterized protein n=1 Tax=Thanatephorus cucumeris (strain AG1-IB / isolate 7/3/14) TaxID=1108050 RepID=A0A0B7F941_THACB|nr:hypothetical protein RSOLAG1IB_11366 [Rhizoctonia solani AG-1 IB]
MNIVPALLKKLQEAITSGDELEEAWVIFHESQSPQLTREWEKLSTEPYMVNNKWASVFLLDNSKAPSRLRTVLDLNYKESARVIESETTEPGFTAPSWLSEGIDLEKLQLRLRRDVADLGGIMTDRQGLEIYNRRMALSKRIYTHRQNTSFFIDVKHDSPGSSPSLAEETDGQPEYAKLYLPSQLEDRLPLTERSKRVTELEKALRRSECFETLRRIRTACIQKSQMLLGKKKNARGEIANTRAQVMVGRLTKRIDNSIAEYSISYESLCKMGLEHDEIHPLRPLNSSSLKGLMQILSGNRELGEGRQKLPWFWAARESGEDASEEIQNKEDVDGLSSAKLSG